MAEINKEARDSFYKELTQRLTAEGYAVEPEADGLLPVRWHGADLCRITAGGGAQFREADLTPDGCREAFDRAVDIAAEVKQYLQLMEAAPVLKAVSQRPHSPTMVPLSSHSSCEACVAGFKQ